jgi:hypothetical protein
MVDLGGLYIDHYIATLFRPFIHLLAQSTKKNLALQGAGGRVKEPLTKETATGEPQQLSVDHLSYSRNFYLYARQLFNTFLIIWSNMAMASTTMTFAAACGF